MKVLHLLSQRPSLTGSGITLDAMIRHAAEAGWTQRAVVGVPLSDPLPAVGGLDGDSVVPLVFGGEPLPFEVPGMSDVMPYPSTVFGDMDDSAVRLYLRSWRDHLTAVINDFRPDVIHSHHVWLMSSIVKDVAPSTPVVTHCHATGLRQMELVPRLADRVRLGCARNDAFVVLHRLHADALAAALGVSEDRIHVVGAGYRDDVFFTRGRDHRSTPALLYVGKYSQAKGLPALLDAFERVAGTHPDLVLHVAGDGAGAEAERIRERMLALAPRVRLHGQVDQVTLAELMRRSTVCVLPSFYEGLPLVLVEALACGCRLVATALPGVVDEIAPRVGGSLELVELPPMAGVDTPEVSGLPAFVDRLTQAVQRAVGAGPVGDPGGSLDTFTWRAVFRRVERVWRHVIEAGRG